MSFDIQLLAECENVFCRIQFVCNFHLHVTYINLCATVNSMEYVGLLHQSLCYSKQYGVCWCATSISVLQ